MKVSFDFDSTLTESDVQKLAKELLSLNYDVYIVTSRVDDVYAKEMNWWWVEKQNKQLYDLAEELGIKRENIVFTQYIDKIEYLKDKNFIFHIDDDIEEIDLINDSTDDCVGIYYVGTVWVNQIYSLLKTKKANY